MRIKPLGEIAEVRLGRQRSPKNHSGPQNRNYVRAANVGWDGLKLDDVKTMNFTDAEMDVYRLRPGDLLLNEASGSPHEVGKPAMWMGEIEECAFQNTLLRVRPTAEVESRYLFHYLRQQALTAAFARGSRGVGIHHLGREALSKWPIPLPPLDEQRRIAAILDCADSVVITQRLILDDLEALTQAVFREMFGDPTSWPTRWPMGRIADMTEDVQYGTSAKAGDTGKWPIIRMGNVTDSGRLDLTDLKWIDLADSDIPKYTLRPGDLLFNRTNSKDKVGKTCVVTTDQPLAFAGYLVRVRFKSQYRPEFVNAFMTSRYGRALRRSMAKAAVNQANINASEMRSIPIALPPTKLQIEFAEAVDDIARQRARQLEAIAQGQVLFASLQSRAFSGRL